MRFASPDPLYAKFGSLSPWSHCAADPLNHFDPDGKEVILYATYLPGFNFENKFLQNLNFPTHTFIFINDKKGQDIYSFGSEYDGCIGMFTGKLERRYYAQDKAVVEGKRNDLIKTSFVITPPEGMTSEEFDARVRLEAEAFAKDTKQTYFFLPHTLNEGNCNTSSSTILLRAGVPEEEIERIKNLIPGVSAGFSSKNRTPTKDAEKADVSIKFHFLIRIFQ